MQYITNGAQGIAKFANGHLYMIRGFLHNLLSINLESGFLSPAADDDIAKLWHIRRTFRIRRM